METWVGIDISKDSFDAAWEQDGKKSHKKFPNTQEGFKALLEWSPDGSKFVMESTGVYFMRCALFLFGCERHVSVENPLAVKRSIQSDLRRCKSDKSDAFSIAKYGREKNPKVWKMPTSEAREARRLQSLIDIEQTQVTALTNLLHAYQQEDLNDLALRECRLAIDRSKRAMAKAEKALEEIIRKRWPKEVNVITSIPGVGSKSACMLVSVVEDFSRFGDSRQFMSWLGMTPKNMQSGTSIHVRGGITKMGNERLRHQFYMCAVASIKFNRRCRTMWERMREKGKPAKVAFIAIACKLLKTAYALVTKGEMYDENFLQFTP